MIFFGKKKTVTLIGKQKEAFLKLDNPGRGFLRVYRFRVEEEVNETYMDSVLGEGECLALVEISLEAFKEENLTPEAINHIHRIMTYFRRRQKDVVLRVCYDLDGKAMDHEPSNLNQVLRHLDQVTEALAAYKTEIFLLQGLLIGKWGEMHGSRFATEDSIRKIYRRFRLSKAGDLYLAVRTPKQLRFLTRENESLAEDEPFLTNLDKIGLFDDALLADDTDMGTFPVGEREHEIAYIHERCVKVPVGGEAITGTGSYTPEQIVATFKGLRLNYLNSQYDLKQLDSWRKLDYQGMKFYDYIETHLGYRIFVKELLWDRKTEMLRLTVENRGFGGLLETAEITVEIQRKIKKDLTLPENIDLTGEDVFEYKNEQRLNYRVHHAAWKAGEELTIELPLVELPKGQYLLSLQLYRKKDGRRIYFVNENAELMDKVPMIQS